MTATPKPGPAPLDSAIARRLASAGFDVATKEYGSYNHGRAREGARVDGAFKASGVPREVSVRWGLASDDYRDFNNDYYRRNAIHYVNAYAEFLADFYDVTVSSSDRMPTVYVKQKPEASAIAKGAPRVKQIAAALDAAGISFMTSRKINESLRLDVLLWQRLDAVELTYNDQADPDAIRAALSDWTVTTFDRLGHPTLRITAKTTEPEGTANAVTDFPAVQRPTEAADLIEAATAADWAHKELHVAGGGTIRLTVTVWPADGTEIAYMSVWTGPEGGPLTLSEIKGLMDAEPIADLNALKALMRSHGSTPATDIAPAPLEGTLAARSGEGAPAEHADHPVIRAVVADLVAAGLTPSTMTSDDNTDGFWVDLRPGNRVSVWYFCNGSTVRFRDSRLGPYLINCFRALRAKGWDVSKDAAVIEIHAETPAPAPALEGPSQTYGYAPEDAAEHPEVLQAVEILNRDSWKPAKCGDPKATGFMVLSYHKGWVQVLTYVDGHVGDMDRESEGELADARLNGYHTALALAGWSAELKTSHSVYAAPPAPEAAGDESCARRYAWQFQTRHLEEEEWSDLVGNGFSGVTHSDVNPSRFAEQLTTWHHVPHRTDVRDVRVCVWDLSNAAQAATVLSCTNIHEG